ncbi:epimerase [Polymorphobacter glacialis]|uniref:Epimerase n=1 Tax=Sandarakinorhabdus glacialis TaxID=1614636 RepID=A0A916ZSE3_9SPHN|nr:NAD-dependent epimerase/dehydratase family protein [Polymorphobacter glacialis]GGE10269.1 epimerase [Polymorphobacter glacialis]
MILAITGGSGFVGGRVLALAKAPVRALMRRPQEERAGAEWVIGDLADTAALARLCAGADTVIHIAGVVSAPDRSGFDAGNVAGTAAVLAAAGGKRFVHVSSLAAREPRLSMYGASKAAAETLVAASDGDWVIVRPPAVYGPGDREMVDIYRLAAKGLAVAPPGRISVMHVDDLARALLALTGGGPSRVTLEIDDGSGGLSHAEFARAVGAGIGRQPVIVPLPVAAVGLAARLGISAKLTRDRAAYIAHPDWTARGGNAALAGIWTPQVTLADGIAGTVADYRARGWI